MVDAVAPRLRWSLADQQPRLFGDESERVTHPEFAGMEFLHVRAKSIINRVPSAAHLPFEHTINVYRGCSHACRFCFARPTHRYLDLDPGRDFERVIVVKINAVERLRAELATTKWSGATIAMGTNTDPYQRAEGRYRLTRGVIEVLGGARNPFSILTRSPLITRDLDVLSAAATTTDVSTAMSIGTLDEGLWKALEPGAPHPRARLEAVAALREARLPVGVMVAPILPGLTDTREQLEPVVRGAIEAGATSITPIVLHLRPGVREHYLDWLGEHRPDLLPRYEQLYAGRRSYVEADEREGITRLVRSLVREHGGPAGPRGRRRSSQGRARTPRARPARSAEPEPQPRLAL